MNHKRFLTQISESPYHALRGYSRKGGSYKNADIGRRIVTETRKSPTNHRSVSSHNESYLAMARNKSIDESKKQVGPQTRKGNFMMDIKQSSLLDQFIQVVDSQKKCVFPATATHGNKLQITPSQHRSHQQSFSQTSNSAKQNQSFLDVTKSQSTKNQSGSTMAKRGNFMIDVKQSPLLDQSMQIVESQKQYYLPEKSTHESKMSTQSQHRSHQQSFSPNSNGMKHALLAKTKSQSTKNQGRKEHFMIDATHASLIDQSIEVITEIQKPDATPQTITKAANFSLAAAQNRQQSTTGSNNQAKHQNQLLANIKLTHCQTSNNESSVGKTNGFQTTINKQQNSKQSAEPKKPIDVQKETLNINQSVQQQSTKRLHPKILWDMSDEEWSMFGDRFPIQFDKKKLLGRGGFSLVWLGEHRKTKDKFAIKQILSNNTHQSHMKEIWFGTFFFESGVPKEKFQQFSGSKNLVRFLAYDVKPQDTWIFYEICGESLGNHLYDLRGESHGQERIYRIYHRSLYQSLRKDNNLLKTLLYELSQALELLSDQRIVHSDLKTENILIKTDKQPNGMHQITQIKLIDYGSSFPFDDLKQFSMATPEYMCPEILNYILYENSLNYHQSLLKYLVKYQKPWVIDIWSLGCVILEIISGIPLWMSLKTLVTIKGKEEVQYGLFAVKGRVFEKIIERQIEVVSNLDSYIEQHSFGGISVDNDLKYLLKRMLALNPEKRISPKEIIEYLEPKNIRMYTQ